MSQLTDYLHAAIAARSLDLPIDTSAPYKVKVHDGRPDILVFYAGAVRDPGVAASSGLNPVEAGGIYESGARFGDQLALALNQHAETYAAAEKKFKRVPWAEVRAGIEVVIESALPTAQRLLHRMVFRK